MYLSVVLPAYNEEENIKSGALSGFWNHLKKQKYSFEIILVDDGSTDKTHKLLTDFAERHKGFKIIKIHHTGKAGAIIKGMQKAKGEIILISDFDQSTPISEFNKFIAKLEVGFDIVIGIRKGRKNAPLARKLTGWGFSLLRKTLLGLAYKDTQCGFKAFKRDAINKILDNTPYTKYLIPIKGPYHGVSFDLEILINANKLSLKVAEVPVLWRHAESKRGNIIKITWQGLRDLIWTIGS